MASVASTWRGVDPSALATKAAAPPPGISRGREVASHRARFVESVEPEHAPIVTMLVPRDQVPASASSHELVRLDRLPPLAPSPVR